MFSENSLLQELEDIEDNKDNLRRLTDQLLTPIGIIPFVGAGLSMPFGFPSWSGFLISQARKAGIEEKINRRLEQGEFEEAAEDLLQARRNRAFHDAISNTFGPHNLEGKELKGSVSLLPQLATGPVITTNFDNVLEEVFKQAGIPFEREVWGANAEMANIALIQQKRFLLKIHGDAEDSTNRILTKSDYAKHYGSSDGSSIDFSLPLPGLLRQMLLGRALLFLGCSLNQDRTIGVLREVSFNARSIAHYAIVEQPTPEALFHERSRFLSDHNIRPIWYPNGRHDLIEPLLTHLLNKTGLRERSAARNSQEVKAEGKSETSRGSAGNWDLSTSSKSKTKESSSVAPSPSSSSQSEQKRRFEAAMPRVTQVEEWVPVHCMISDPGSPGLRAKLPSEAKINVVDKKDIRSNEVSLEFPVDKSSQVMLPINVFLTIKTRDFDPVDPPGKIHLSPKGDPVEINFFLAPKRPKKLAYVILSLFKDRKCSVLIGSVTMSTEIRKSAEGIGQLLWQLATLPLNMAIAFPKFIEKKRNQDRNITLSESDREIILQGISDLFIREIERKLRMERAHWVDAGFEIPEKNFNFTAVYFSNQIDKLRQYQMHINDICLRLQSGKLNVSNDEFVLHLKEFLVQINFRCTQIDDLISSGAEFDQMLNVQKQIERIKTKSEILSVVITKSAFEGIQRPNRLPQLNGQIRVSVYEIGSAIRDLIPYLGQIYSLSEKSVI